MLKALVSAVRVLCIWSMLLAVTQFLQSKVAVCFLFVNCPQNFKIVCLIVCQKDNEKCCISFRFFQVLKIFFHLVSLQRYKEITEFTQVILQGDFTQVILQGDSAGRSKDKSRCLPCHIGSCPPHKGADGEIFLGKWMPVFLTQFFCIEYLLLNLRKSVWIDGNKALFGWAKNKTVPQKKIWVSPIYYGAYLFQLLLDRFVGS